MFRRPWVRWGLVISLVLLLSAGLAWFFSADPITPDNCDRITKGMSLEEVEGILGPAKDGPAYRMLAAKGFFIQTWWGDTGSIVVHFNSSRRVHDVNPFDPKSRRGYTVLDRFRILRSRVGW